MHHRVRPSVAPQLHPNVPVAVVDAALGANYMWLREKPPSTILDLFGPWPYYILGGAVLGIALFLLLDLPYRITARRSG